MTRTLEKDVPWLAERQAVLAAARAMLARGLVSGMSGNVSMRLKEPGGGLRVAITPSQRPYETLRPEDVVIVDAQGDPVEGDMTPSSETLLHLGIYRARPDVGAVMHTHSVYASVLAVAALALPPIIDEMVAVIGGAIEVADYGFPGSEELAERACRALGERNAVFLRNHGLAGAGRTPEDALAVCELVERASQIYVLASLLGKAHALAPEVVSVEQDLFRMRRRAGGA